MESQTVTPFDDLTFATLIFLKECTCDREPWCGLGFFGTEVHHEICKAIKRKEKIPANPCIACGGYGKILELEYIPCCICNGKETANTQ